MQKNAAMSITGLETKRVKGETSLKGDWGWGCLLQPRGEERLSDEAAAKQSATHTHGKIYYLNSILSTQSAREYTENT